MYVKLPSRDLNPDLYPPHPTSIYTYVVTTALRVSGGSLFDLYCIRFWEMLKNTVRALVNNLFKEIFYGKRKEKKKIINVLTVFFISYKSEIKTS